MSTSVTPLARDEVAEILDELRNPLVRGAAAQPENRHFSVDALADVYSKATVLLLGKDPFPIFEHRAQVYEFMRLTLRNVIRDERKWHARHPEAQLLDDADLTATAQDGGTEARGETPKELIEHDDPAAEAQLNQQADKVSEWAATVREDDMAVALLKFHPNSFASTKDIAKRLGIPLEDCQAAVRRLTKSFNKYMADDNEANICASQRIRAQEWLLNGGRMPVSLKIHTRRCPSCETALVAIRRQRTEAYDALVPLAGAVAVSTGGGLTVLQRLGARRAAHKMTSRVTGVGKGGATAGRVGSLIATKAVGTPVIVAALAAGAVGAGAVVAHAVTSSPHVASKTGQVGTVSTHARSLATAPSTKTRTTTVTHSKARKKPKRHESIKHKAARTRTVAATTTTATSQTVITPATTTRSTAGSSSAANSSQTPGGALPDPQQASQVP